MGNLRCLEHLGQGLSALATLRKEDFNLQNSPAMLTR